MKPHGFAYAHTQGGRCLVLQGERTYMIDLCDRVKRSTLESGPAIFVQTSDFDEIHYLENGDCPMHKVAAA
jgi:hypothetical protein